MISYSSSSVDHIGLNTNIALTKTMEKLFETTFIDNIFIYGGRLGTRSF